MTLRVKQFTRLRTSFRWHRVNMNPCKNNCNRNRTRRVSGVLCAACCHTIQEFMEVETCVGCNETLHTFLITDGVCNSCYYDKKQGLIPSSVFEGKVVEAY